MFNTKFRSRYSLFLALMLVIAIVLLSCSRVSADPDTNHDELILPRDNHEELLDIMNSEEEDTDTPFEEVFDFDLDHYRDDGSEDNVLPIHRSLLDEMVTNASEFNSELDLESEERKRCENLRDVLINKGNFTELVHKRFALSYKTSPHIPFSGVYRRAFGVKRFVHKLVHSTAIEKSDLRVMAVNPVVGLCVLESNLTLRSRKTNHTESDVKHVLVFKSWGNKYAGARIYDHDPEVFMQMVKLYTTAAERSAWKLSAAIYSKGYKSKRVRRHLHRGTEIILNTVGYSRHGRQVVFKGTNAIRKSADWAVENLWKPHMGPKPRPHPKPKPKPKYEDDYDYYEDDDDEYNVRRGYDFDDEDEEFELTRRNRRHETMYVADEHDMEDIGEYLYSDHSNNRRRNRRHSDDYDEDEYDMDNDDDVESGWRRRRRHHHHHHHDLRRLLKTTFPLGLPFTPHWCDIHASNDTHIAGSCFIPPIMRRHKHILPPFIVGEIYLNAPQIRFTMEFTSCGMLHRLEYTPLQPTPIHGYWNHEKKKDDEDDKKRIDEDDNDDDHDRDMDRYEDNDDSDHVVEKENFPRNDENEAFDDSERDDSGDTSSESSS